MPKTTNNLSAVLKQARQAVQSGKISKADVRAGKRVRESLKSHPERSRALVASLGKRRMSNLKRTLILLWERILSGRMQLVDGLEFDIVRVAAMREELGLKEMSIEEMAEDHLGSLIYLAAGKVYSSHLGKSYPKLVVQEVKLVRTGWTQAEVQVTQVDTLIDLPGADGTDPEKPNRPGPVYFDVAGHCRLNLVATLPGVHGPRRVIAFTKLVRHPFYQYGTTSSTTEEANHYELKNRGVRLD